MIDLPRLIDAVDALAPLSPTAARLAQVVAASDTTVDDIAEVLQFDQALTMDVLRFANSAASASSRTISTLREAVIRMGGTRILGHLVAHHLHKGMSDSLAAYGYSENELWRHSVASALAAEQLAACIRTPMGGFGFTAALLHDIGKLILVRFVPMLTMQRVWALAAKNSIAAVDAEREITGIDHASVGARICEHWGLPEPLVNAVRWHHSVTEGLEPLTDLVRLANVAARSMGEGVGHEGMSCALDKGIDARTGLTKELFEKVCVNASERLGAVLAQFGVS